MRRLRTIGLASLAFGLLSTQTFAGNQTGTVQIIQTGQGYTSQNVYALVTLTNTHHGQPACANAGDQRWALNPATEWGKAMLAVLLTAQSTGKTVEAFGTNTCSVMGTDHEDISYLRIKD